MHPVEIKEVLDSLTILVDRREQPTQRAMKRYKRFDCPYERATLNYGDYAANARLPNGKWIYDVSDTVKPLAVVERKMNLDELAGCFCHGRERFEREFQRAADNGSRIYLLVEDGSWGTLQLHGYRSKMNPKALMASIVAYMVRYNMNLIFCDEATSPRLIREILYRDLKERLERGDFDE